MSAAVALSEGQVQRYSRAILLRGVGGRGQEALLATGAHLTAGGPVLLTAAAYLAAGGTPVRGPPGMLAPGDAGFLVEASELGMPAAPVLRRAAERSNPDAVASSLHWGTLAALPGGGEGARPLVAVGTRAGKTVLWAAGPDACPQCLAASVQGAGAPPAGPAAIHAGALAAMLFERLVLGLGPPLSGLALGADGAAEPLAVPVCSHRPVVPASVLGEAVRHLEACYPEEGCGVVLDGPGGPRWVALRNAYAAWAARDPAAFPRDARSAFVFEPTEWLALLRAADGRGERVAAIVHGHPDGLAAFSREDRSRAAPEGIPLVPRAAHLVVAVSKGRATGAIWATWDGRQFSERPLSLPE